VIVIPAIDIRGAAACASSRATTTGSRSTRGIPPRSSAADRERRPRIHLVDLDAAGDRGRRLRRGGPRRSEAARQGGVEIEVGEASAPWRRRSDGWPPGDLRRAGERGGARAEAAEAICAALPGRCLVSLDVRGDVAQAEGWTEGAGSAAAHLERWATWPLGGLSGPTWPSTGCLSGPDLAGLEQAARVFPGPVIASGGISTVDDIARCAEAGAAGAIVGRAMYEGSFDLRAAMLRFPR